MFISTKTAEIFVDEAVCGNVAIELLQQIGRRIKLPRNLGGSIENITLDTGYLMELPCVPCRRCSINDLTFFTGQESGKVRQRVRYGGLAKSPLITVQVAVDQENHYSKIVAADIGEEIVPPVPWAPCFQSEDVQRNNSLRESIDFWCRHSTGTFGWLHPARIRELLDDAGVIMSTKPKLAIVS